MATDGVYTIGAPTKNATYTFTPGPGMRLEPCGVGFKIVPGEPVKPRELAAGQSGARAPMNGEARWAAPPKPADGTRWKRPTIEEVRA